MNFKDLIPSNIDSLQGGFDSIFDKYTKSDNSTTNDNTKTNDNSTTNDKFQKSNNVSDYKKPNINKDVDIPFNKPKQSFNNSYDNKLVDNDKPINKPINKPFVKEHTFTNITPETHKNTTLPNVSINELSTNISLSNDGPNMNTLKVSNLSPIQSALYQVPTINNTYINFTDTPYANVIRQNMIYEDILPKPYLPENILTVNDRLQTCKYINNNILDRYAIKSQDRSYIGETLSNLTDLLNKEIDNKKVSDLYTKLKTIRFNPYNVIKNSDTNRTPFNNMPLDFLLYQSCYPIQKSSNNIICADKNHKLNVRIYKYQPELYYNIFRKSTSYNIDAFYKSHLGKEIQYYKYVKDEIVSKLICPNFILHCGFVDDLKDNDIQFENFNNAVNNIHTEVKINDLSLNDKSYIDMYFKNLFTFYQQLINYIYYKINSELSNDDEINKTKKIISNLEEIINKLKNKFINTNSDIPEKRRNDKINIVNLIKNIIYPIYQSVDIKDFNKWVYNLDNKKNNSNDINVNDDKTFNKDDILKIFNNQVLIMLTEAPYCSILQWMSREYTLFNNVKKMTYSGIHTNDEWKNILFQLLYTFHVIEKKKIYIPDFNIKDNIFIKPIQSSVSNSSSFNYNVDNIDYFIPNYGYLMVVDSKFNNKSINSAIKNNIYDTYDDNLNITKSHNIDDDIICNYDNINYKSLMRDYMINIINDLSQFDNNDVQKLDDTIEIYANVKSFINNNKSNEFVFRDAIINYFFDYMNNRIGSALSMEEFKNLPAGDLQPLFNYNAGDLVLYKDNDQYKITQIVSNYDNTNPDVKYIDVNGINKTVKTDNISKFYKMNTTIKQFNDTYERKENNNEVYRI